MGYHWSFRAKVFLSQLVLSIAFFAILMPFVQNTLTEIVRRGFVKESKLMIKILKTANNEEQLISLMQHAPEAFLFTRASLFDAQGNQLYETPFFETGKSVQSDQDIQQALKTGSGYLEAQIGPDDKHFAFVAKVFKFQNKKYILRTVYPYDQIEETLENFERSFLILGSVLLLFFIAVTWFVFSRLSQPIQQIIQAIKPYQQGKTDDLPKITLSSKLSDGDEIRKLADTLNSLSERVKSQVQRLREERNEKEAILESLGEGVVAVDSSLTLQYVNFMGSKMLGISRKQTIGKPFLKLEETAKRPLIESCKNLIQNCQQQREVVTDSISYGNGRKTYLDLIAAPKANEKGVILVLQDNSNHYRILEMGKDFVANASHELRTPITIIRGFTETLQDLPELSTEMLHDITDKILRSCQRMDHLVKSLLTLADIENMPLTHRKKYDLIDLVEECKDRLLTVHTEATVDIKIEGAQPAYALIVKDLLELAIFNLLENAVKYSKPPAHISLHLRNSDDEIVISIADRGIGIPQADLEHIFDRFYTVNKAHSRKLGGAGIGLSIVKTIIDKHDGAISVSSEFGKGTCFTIVLPTGESN